MRSGQGTVRSGHGQRGTGHHGGARVSGRCLRCRGNGQNRGKTASRGQKSGRCGACGAGTATSRRHDGHGARSTGHGARGTAACVAPCCALSRPVLLHFVALSCCTLLLSLSVALCCVSRRPVPVWVVALCCVSLCCSLLRVAVCCSVCCTVLRGLRVAVCCGCCGVLRMAVLLRFVAAHCGGGVYCAHDKFSVVCRSRSHARCAVRSVLHGAACLAETEEEARRGGKR